jgi:hypothetical protein
MNVKIAREQRASSIGGGEVEVVQGPQGRRKVGQGKVARHTPSFVICPVSVRTGCRNEQAPFEQVTCRRYDRSNLLPPVYSAVEQSPVDLLDSYPGV